MGTSACTTSTSYHPWRTLMIANRRSSLEWAFWTAHLTLFSFRPQTFFPLSNPLNVLDFHQILLEMTHFFDGQWKTVCVRGRTTEAKRTRVGVSLFLFVYLKTREKSLRERERQDSAPPHLPIRAHQRCFQRWQPSTGCGPRSCARTARRRARFSPSG